MCSEPKSLHSFEKQRLFFALRFMWFTTLMTSFKASSSTGTIPLAASASRCRKQWFHVALGALSRICFTAPECFPVSCESHTVFPAQTHRAQIQVHNIENVLCLCSGRELVGTCLDASYGLFFNITRHVFNASSYSVIGQWYGFQPFCR